MSERKVGFSRGASDNRGDTPSVVRHAFVWHYGRSVWDCGGRRRRRVKSLRYEFPFPRTPFDRWCPARREAPRHVGAPATTSVRHLASRAPRHPPRRWKTSRSSVAFVLRYPGRDKWYPSGQDQSINYVQLRATRSPIPVATEFAGSTRSGP